METKEMTGTGIIRDAMKKEGITQREFAALLGYKGNSAVSGRLSSPHISLDKFAEMLGAMGYEVIVRKSGEHSEDSTQWKVTE